MTVEVFKKLDDYNQSRLRTEMYFGSREPHTQSVLGYDGTSLSYKDHTWVPAILTSIRELIDNALDELIGYGYGDTIKLDYDEENFIFTIEDNGRGLPIHEIPELGKGPAASILLGEARAGRNFGERQEVAGANGLGAAVSNFTSEYFHLDVYRDDKHFSQKWKEQCGEDTDTHKTAKAKIVDRKSKKTGTIISYKLSHKVFPNRQLGTEFLLNRFWDIAVINPKLKVYFNGTRLSPKSGKDPIASTYFGDMSPLVMEVNDEGVKSKFFMVPDFHETDEIQHCVVNNILALQGGPFMDHFKQLVFNALGEILEKKLKKEKLTLRKDDIFKRMLVMNVTFMKSAKFDSQTKSRLVSDIKKELTAGFNQDAFKALVRKNPAWIEGILERCRSRLNAKITKEVTTAQKKLHRAKVANLSPATSQNRQECILFIAEGESAISGLVSARNPKIHGGIGLRGKIMNVTGMNQKQVLDNKVLSDLMTVIGLKFGDKDRRSLEYNTIYITTDEDEDGKSITSLLVNFFYTFWPHLMKDTKNPFLYKFETPLIILKKGNQRKYIYVDEYEEFQKNPERHKGWHVTRAKGLAALEKLDWKMAMDKPRLIPIVADDNLQDTLDKIFNKKRADDRKTWLSGEI